MEKQTDELVFVSDYLERQMLTLPAERTEKERRSYLAGIITALLDFQVITEEIHDELYFVYAF